MTDEHEYLSEDDATRLWQRAAQLQAEAARRAEADAAARAAEGAAADDDDDRAEGYALQHVRTAAVEAGIGEEFVEAALADLRAEQAIPAADADWVRRLSHQILGRPDAAITVRRTVHSPPDRVLAAMEEILPAEPYTLSLRERHGDPSQGGLLVFDILGVGFTSQGEQGFKGDASTADLRQIYASVRPLPGDDPPTSELTLRAPVAWAFGLNALLGTVFTGLGGASGFGVGVAAAAGAAALLGPGTAAAAAAALVLSGSTLAGGGAGGKLFRVLYRYGVGRGRSALEGVAAAVAAKAQGGWGIAPKAPDAPALPPSP